MRWKQIVAGAATLGIGLLLCGEAIDSIAAAAEPNEQHVPPSIEAVRELAELTVLEVEATEVVTHAIRGHTGGTTSVVLVVGTITLGVDLEQARFVEVDQERRHLVLALPSPTVRQFAIDPVVSRALHTRRDGLWQVTVGSAHEGRAFAQALVIGQQRIENAASRSDLTAQTKRQAEAVLQRFSKEIECTLEVRWDE